jgi:putative membrane protein
VKDATADPFLVREVNGARLFARLFSCKTGEAKILKGRAAVAVGGLVASWTMNQFQKVWSAAEKEITGGKQGQDEGQKNGEDAEDATMKTADRISQALQGRHLTKDEKKKAGPVVHYAFGALMGAVYGATVEVNPAANALAGIPFGAILFAGGPTKWLCPRWA